MFTPGLEVITGCVCSRKSGELIHRADCAQIAGLQVDLFKPKHDTRSEEVIRSRSGPTMRAIEIVEPTEMFARVANGHGVVCVDEAQFFDTSLVPVALALVRRGNRVIVSGLDLDFREQPFEVMAQLLALATLVQKRTAVCMKCREREAPRAASGSLPLTNGFSSATKNTNPAASCATSRPRPSPPPSNDGGSFLLGSRQ